MNIKNINSFSDWFKLYKLYKKAFPKYERKPLLLILKTYRSGNTDIWILENEDEFGGFAITLNSKDMVLLDYFAVSENMRGKGIGGKALGMLQEKYKGKRFFLEIESTTVPSDNRDERIRRKSFYINNNMNESGLCVDLFGTEMEVLTYNCKISFEEYLSVYKDNFGWLVGNNIKNLSE